MHVSNECECRKHGHHLRDKDRKKFNSRLKQKAAELFEEANEPLTPASLSRCLDSIQAITSHSDLASTQQVNDREQSLQLYAKKLQTLRFLAE